MKKTRKIIFGFIPIFMVISVYSKDINIKKNKRNEITKKSKNIEEGFSFLPKSLYGTWKMKKIQSGNGISYLVNEKALYLKFFKNASFLSYLHSNPRDKTLGLWNLNRTILTTGNYQQEILELTENTMTLYQKSEKMKVFFIRVHNTPESLYNKKLTGIWKMGRIESDSGMEYLAEDKALFLEFLKNSTYKSYLANDRSNKTFGLWSLKGSLLTTGNYQQDILKLDQKNLVLYQKKEKLKVYFIRIGDIKEIKKQELNYFLRASSPALGKDSFLFFDSTWVKEKSSFHFWKWLKKVFSYKTYEKKRLGFIVKAGAHFYHPDGNQVDSIVTAPFGEVSFLWVWGSPFYLELGLGYSKTSLRFSEYAEIMVDYLYSSFELGINAWENNLIRTELGGVVQTRFPIASGVQHGGTGNFYQYSHNAYGLFLGPRLTFTFKLSPYIKWLKGIHLFKEANVFFDGSLFCNIGRPFWAESTVYLQSEGYPDLNISEKKLTEYQIRFGLELWFGSN